jgi:hypothetical protein
VTVIELSQDVHVDGPGCEVKEENSVSNKDLVLSLPGDPSTDTAKAIVSPPLTADSSGTKSAGKPPMFLPLKTSTPGNSTAGNVSSKPPLAGFPMLPPPPPSNKGPVRAVPQLLVSQPKGLSSIPAEARLKSKSLPRGLPSDGSLFDKFRDRKKEGATVAAPVTMEPPSTMKGDEDREELLLLEEMRLKFEYEELLNLKSELERRKKTERREVAELQVSGKNHRQTSSGGGGGEAVP